MSDDTGKKRFIKDFLNNVQQGTGLIEDIRVERTIRAPGSTGEGSTAKSLSGRQISNITQLLEDDLKRTFDEGYFTFRFVAALVGSGKTALLTYLHELTKTKPTHQKHSVVVEFQLSDVPMENNFREKLYCHILAHTFYELLHNPNILPEVREVSERILGEFLELTEVALLQAAKSLMPFRNKFKKFIASNYRDSLEEFLFYIIAEISAVDPKFSFVYLIDELDALEKFDSEIKQTRLLFKELIRRAFQVFNSKIRLLIYLVGTSEAGNFITGDSVIKSLIGDSIINLNKGFNNEFAEIISKINNLIKGAYKRYKNFDQAWKEIEDIKINMAQNPSLREFCKEYGSAVLKIHAKYFEEVPEQVFEGDARQLLEAKCRQAWANYLKQKTYKLEVSPTNKEIAGHSFDCYAELKHKEDVVAKAFGEAKNYALLISHFKTFKEWLNDAEFNPFKVDGTPNDLAFMIAPSCSSLLQRKLKLQNIEYIEAPKVTTITDPAPTDSVATTPVSTTSVATTPVPTTPVSTTSASTPALRIWKCRYTLSGHSSWVYGVPITPNGKILVTHSNEKIILWDTSNFKRIFNWKGHTDTIFALTITPDGQTLATASKDQEIKIWDLQTHSLISSLRKYADPIHALAFSPSGNILASGGSKKYKAFDNNVGIYLWDINTQNLLSVLYGQGHLLRINSLAFSPDGEFLVSGSNDKTVKIWNLRDKKLIRTLSEHSGTVNCVAITPNGKTVISSGGGGVKIWDLVTGELKNTLESDCDLVRCLAISLDGKTLAYHDCSSIKIWDLENDKPLQTLTRNLLDPITLSFHPDGKTLVVGNAYDPVTVWQLS
jgi:WD40 repeat protein